MKIKIMHNEIKCLQSSLQLCVTKVMFTAKR